jgi:hypothetical protein
MKNLRSLLIIISILSIGFTACNKSINDEGQGELTFAIGSELKSLVKSAQIDSIQDSLQISSVIVTIVNSSNQVVLESKKINLYSFGGSLVSEPIKLSAGLYKITKFFVANTKNNIIYAAPVQGSDKAHLVSKPLYIDFVIAKNSTVQIAPEVLPVANCTPESFGYARFGFSVVDYTSVKIQAYIDSMGTYMSTDAMLYVEYKNAQGDSLYNMPGFTTYLQAKENEVFINKASRYLFTIYKQGYKTVQIVTTADSLLYNNKFNIYLQKYAMDSTLLKLSIGLVSQIKFDGTFYDSIRNSMPNEYGNIPFISGISGQAALFNAISYLSVNTIPSSNGLTISFWARPDSIMTGNGVIIGKYVPLGYGFRVYTSLADSAKIIAEFSGQSGIDVVESPMWGNGWNHYVVNVTNTNIQFWLNGYIVSSTSRKNVSYPDGNYPITIGNLIMSGSNSHYYSGSLDELRIYNRPLTSQEINYLYVHQL